MSDAATPDLSPEATASHGASDRESLRGLRDDEIIALIAEGRRLRRAALLELIDRASNNPRLVPELARLAADPRLREDRLFHLISMAWVAIIGLLSIETPTSRALAEEAFEQLDARDQGLLLDYLHVEQLHDAHPPLH